MTESPHAPAVSFEDVDGAIERLRDAGLRISSPRRQLLQALFEASGPVSAERLARSLAGSSEWVDVASVYRNLELLERLGIVRHVHLGHGPGLYALAGEGEREYLVCDRCGDARTVEAAELDAVRDEIRRAFDFEVRFSHFALTGLCARCAVALAESAGLQSRPSQPGGEMSEEHEHGHDDAHAHEHSHGDVTHSHPHDDHEHEHVEHEHEHSHGDQVHSHPHTHQEGLEHEHEHEHDD
jgi:Fur family transcriptional regulator, ferric uptake regulator